MTATIEMEKINLAEAGDLIEINEEYRIEFPEGDNLLIVVPVDFNSSAAKFDHPNIVAKRKSVLSFKHYHPKRGKFWTEKPGLEYCFIVPKKNISVLLDKGYSYVKIEIGGREYVLNASGGSANGWTDWVTHGTHTTVYRSAKYLKEIAENAIMNDTNIDLNMRPLEDWEQARFNLLSAEAKAKKRLKEGDKIILTSGCTYEGSNGPFLITNRPKRKRHFLCVNRENDMWKVKIYYKHIDWKKTAEINGIEYPTA